MKVSGYCLFLNFQVALSYKGNHFFYELDLFKFIIFSRTSMKIVNGKQQRNSLSDVWNPGAGI